MNKPEDLSDSVKDLIDDYLSGLLDEARMCKLEEVLHADADARTYFVRYSRLHTDLHLEMRAQQASGLVLDRIEELTQGQDPPLPLKRSNPYPRRRFPVHLLRWGLLTAAASLLLAAGLGWWSVKGRSHPDNTPGNEPAIAWLVNAQNCQWSEGEPAGNMQAGTVLKLERGLAEICFQCGARVVLQGRADLELLSERSARLMRGKLTARVPEPALGFEILSPQGKVIDLGTEFGISVLDEGATDVYVFEGKVVARPTENGQAEVGAISLIQNQAARMVAGQVTLQPRELGVGADQFVRAIIPPPVILPRTLRLDFDHAVPGSIRDQNGLGTGLTQRLAGTGRALTENDPNLRLDIAKAQLELTTTNSDLNTGYQLHHGEYLGFRLSDLGFTGEEDFAVTVTIPNIPALEVVGQFGLYAAAGSDRSIRGGLLIDRGPGEYTQFLVTNNDRKDADPCKVGLLSTGTDLRLTLKRTRGEYSLTAENLTNGSGSTLTIPRPAFLDSEKDLYVGLFGANTQSNVRKTLVIKELQVMVWTVAPASPR
jgi:ferric-dicitrate binding protein FerR (iron transport regulator)